VTSSLTVPAAERLNVRISAAWDAAAGKAFMR
jgi:hypothetical protein